MSYLSLTAALLTPYRGAHQARRGIAYTAGRFQSTTILPISIPKGIKHAEMRKLAEPEGTCGACDPPSPAKGSSGAYLGQQRLPVLQPAVRGLRSPARSAFPDDAFLYGCVCIADFLDPVGLSCKAEVMTKAFCP